MNMGSCVPVGFHAPEGATLGMSIGQAAPGRTEKLDFANSFFGINIFCNFSVRRERAYIAQSLMGSSGSGVWTLQSHPISCCLKICLSFLFKSVLGAQSFSTGYSAIPGLFCSGGRSACV